MSLRIGEKVRIRGLISKSSNLVDLRRFLWKYLCRKFGNYELFIISNPFSARDYRMLVLTNEDTEEYGKGPYASVEGVIDELYRYAPYAGRFIICDKLERYGFERVYEFEKPRLSSEKLEAIYLGDRLHESLMSFTMSSPPYLERAGGNSLTIFTAEEREYVTVTTLLRKYVSYLHPILRSGKVYLKAEYDIPIEINSYIKIDSPITIKKFSPEKTYNYLLNRKNIRELSILTDFEIKSVFLKNVENFYLSHYNKLLVFSELPLIPQEEELWLPEIDEHALDIAYFVIYNQYRVPNEIIPKEYLKKSIDKILSYAESYLPLLREAMNYGLIVDISKVGGIWEHLSRISHSYVRLGYDVERALSKSIDIYIDLLDRIYDCTERIIKAFLSSLSERKKLERVIDRVLFELSIYRPEGWSYSEYEERMGLRGFEPYVAEKILKELLLSGKVYEISINKYKVA